MPAVDASISSLAEFPGNPNVLFAGTERALFVTQDTGAKWTKLAVNLPTTRYADIIIHPRTKDMIRGTDGRGIWILNDVTPGAAAVVAAKRAAAADSARARRSRA